MDHIKALTFDTGGTILDWYTGISTKLAEIGARRGVEADWQSLTAEYRIRSLLGMTGGDEDFKPDFNIDDVHREQIESVIKEHGITSFTDDDYDQVRDAWHSLDCWPDVPSGLARLRTRFIVASFTILSTRLIIDTCKRSNIIWDTVIACEAIGHYKPRPQAYRTAAQWLQLEPSECLMVAAHGSDLAAAAAVGFSTAFIQRPSEWGPAGEPDFMKSDQAFHYVASDFEDLADQLNCR